MLVRFSTNEHKLGCILCLLFASMVILILYTSLEERAVVQTMDAPSNSTEYEHFRQIYPSTLECTCSRSYLPYNTIIPKLEVESFHPICNSSFVAYQWFNFLLPSMYFPTSWMNENYDQWIVPLFRLLATLCSTARDQVNQSILTFLSSSTVVNRLISAEQFEGQLNTTITQLQQQIPAQFAQMVDSIRLSQQGNALISVFSSNWQYVVRNNNRSVGAVLGRQPVTVWEWHLFMCFVTTMFNTCFIVRLLRYRDLRSDRTSLGLYHLRSSSSIILRMLLFDGHAFAH